MRFSDGVQQWLNYKASYWAPPTTRNMATFAGLWNSHFGGKPLEEIRIEDIEQYEAIRARNCVAGSLNTERAVLKSFFSYAQKHQWVERNPVQSWKARRDQKDEEYYQILTAEDERKVMEFLDEDMRNFVAFALYTGLRIGTILQLRAEWVDSKGILTVPAEFMKSKRTHKIPLVDQLLPFVRQKEGLLFPNLTSRGLVHMRFKRACRKAGLNPRLKIHDLRRTFATRLLDRGVAMPVVMRLGDWQRLGIVFKHYMARLEEKTAREALKVL